MPITLNCPKCHKPFRVRDESIGGRVRCPSCGSVLQVPGALAPASHFGDDPRSEAPARRCQADGRGLTRSGRLGWGRSDEALRGRGRSGGAVDLNPPAGAAMPGPPSIRATSPGAPRSGPRAGAAAPSRRPRSGRRRRGTDPPARRGRPGLGRGGRRARDDPLGPVLCGWCSSGLIGHGAWACSTRTGQ